MTEYARTLEWLYALEAARGMDFKLERVALALARLGDPQRAFRSLHIGGTNGKGSVAAMLESILDAAGLRVGLYTSPHLVELTERVRVGGREIAREELVALTDEIRSRVSAAGIDLTFFEFLTVLAFVHFARARVDVAVVEVGLGGRLDATNVLEPLAAAITTIGLDHEQWLGSSIAEIAAEKGGIIKPGRPVVFGRLPPAARTVLSAMAAEQGAPALMLGRDYDVRVGAGGLRFEGSGRRIDALAIGLRGAHQEDNAGVAVALLASVADVLPVGDDAVRIGLARVRWPGRLEVVEGVPPIVLDGGHNADGMAALVRALPDVIGNRPVRLLFAVMGDKDWRSMVEVIAPRCASVVVTEVLPPRGAPATAVAEQVRCHCPAIADPDAGSAWDRILAVVRPDEAIVVTGSLFLVGAVRGRALSAARPHEDPSLGTLHP